VVVVAVFVAVVVVFTAVAGLIVEIELNDIALPVAAVSPADAVPHSVLHLPLHSVKHVVYSASFAADKVGLAAAIPGDKAAAETLDVDAEAVPAAQCPKIVAPMVALSAQLLLAQSEFSLQTPPMA
jgi:hypothetical protein